mmetsp:Transcript_25063/g.51805  ORF Transcript_25063/g.51805 Transcript_25063/m.51805 type:complete len:104 (-) Transcript_25063:21-332(-)
MMISCSQMLLNASTCAMAALAVSMTAINPTVVRTRQRCVPIAKITKYALAFLTKKDDECLFCVPLLAVLLFESGITIRLFYSTQINRWLIVDSILTPQAFDTL